MGKKHIGKLVLSGDEIVSSALPHIEFESNEQAVIEGSEGIIEYSENTVKFNCENLIVKFSGCDLTINALSADRVCVSGQIISLEFCN